MVGVLKTDFYVSRGTFSGQNNYFFGDSAKIHLNLIENFSVGLKTAFYGTKGTFWGNIWEINLLLVHTFSKILQFEQKFISRVVKTAIYGSRGTFWEINEFFRT